MRVPSLDQVRRMRCEMTLAGEALAAFQLASCKRMRCLGFDESAEAAQAAAEAAAAQAAAEAAAEFLNPLGSFWTHSAWVPRGGDGAAARRGGGGARTARGGGASDQSRSDQSR